MVSIRPLFLILIHLLHVTGMVFLKIYSGPFLSFVFKILQWLALGIKKKKNQVLNLQGSPVLTPACLTSSFLALLPLILSLYFFPVLKHLYLSLLWDFDVKGPCAPEMDFPENPSLLLPEAGQLPLLGAIFALRPSLLYVVHHPNCMKSSPVCCLPSPLEFKHHEDIKSVCLVLCGVLNA